MDDSIPTRATLIQRLKDWQDQSSWQDFFDTYWRLIYNLARKGGLSETEAQDVVQETMISVARHMPNFKYDPAIGSFKSWLLQMTRWRMTDQLRKREPVVRPLERVADPTSEDLEALWNAEWEKNLLDAAIVNVKRRFDPEKYQIFDLYMNKGWSPEKVAKAFGISIGQVYLAKHRVTEMIKAEVSRLESGMT